MDEDASGIHFPDVDAFVTNEGRGVDFSKKAFADFVTAIEEALDAPVESDAARRLRQGMETAYGTEDGSWDEYGVYVAWLRGLDRALTRRAATHVANNTDLAPEHELEEDLRTNFRAEWADDYLQSVDAGETSTPLWPYVEARWLDHLRRRRAERRKHPPELGILFVHGIGTQTRGDTLEQFGRPVLEWFGDRAHLREATLRGGDDETPAHAIVDLPESGSSWLLAESWWAEQFGMPSFVRLGAWLTTIGPSLALAHLGKWVWQRFRRVVAALSPPPHHRWLWTVSAVALLPIGVLSLAGTVALSFLLTVTLQGVALSLTVLSLIPILRSKALIANAMAFLRSVLGDSMAFADNLVARAAILTRVRDDLAWLADRAKTVVVVAHSQGAAVTHHVLRRDVPPNVEALISVGSGLGKLERARSTGWDAVQRSVGWVVPTMPIFVWFAPRLVEAFGSVVTYVAIFYLTAFVTALTAALKTSRTELSLSPLRWVDYYASHDPVPNGPLTLEQKGRWIESHEVCNYRSMLADHTSYFENEDEFVPALLRDIEKHVDSEALSSTLDRRAQEGARARRRRVRWLQALRIGAVLACLGGAVLAGAGLQELGRSGVEIETSRLPTDYLAGATRRAVSVLTLFTMDANTASAWSSGALGGLILAVLVVPFYLFGRWCWHAWNRTAMRAARDPTPDPEDEPLPSEEFLIGSPILLRAVSVVLGIGGTSLLLVLDLSGWGAQLVAWLLAMATAVCMVPMMPFITYGPAKPPYRLAMIVTMSGMLWVALRTATSLSFGRAYVDLWSAARFLGTKLLEQPEAFVPIAIAVGFPLAAAVMRTLQR